MVSPGRRAELDALHATIIPEALWAEVDALGPAPSPVDDSAFA
ncbi:hypothetical protein [Microbacterium marinum]